MRPGSIFRYAQVLVVALVMAVNPFGMAAASITLPSRHCAVGAEAHHQGGPACGQQTACCSAMHYCSILPDLAAVAARHLDPGRHARVPSIFRPLLLIRAIDPPPRSPAG